jgi:hypothetical protein
LQLPSAGLAACRLHLLLWLPLPAAAAAAAAQLPLLEHQPQYQLLHWQVSVQLPTISASGLLHFQLLH